MNLKKILVGIDGIKAKGEIDREVTTIEKEFTSEVTEYVQPDYPDVDPAAPTEEKTSVVPFVIGGVVIVGAVAAFVIIKKKKARRAAELEDEDEDIWSFNTFTQ